MPTIFGDKVTIGAITFNDRPMRPVGAARWGLDVLDGWDVMPPVDVRMDDLGSDDGEYIADRFPMRRRTLIVGGYGHFDTRTNAEAAKDALTSTALPRNKDIILTRYEGTPKFITGRVAARAAYMVGPNSFRWDATLVCADPLKYGIDEISGEAGIAGSSLSYRSYPRTYPLTYTSTDPTATAAQSISLVNTGSADVRPIITIQGPIPTGWNLINETTDEEFAADIALSASDVLVIDFANEIMTLNGYAITTNITGDFWTVQSGQNIIKLFGEFDPAARVTATIKPGWE